MKLPALLFIAGVILGGKASAGPMPECDLWRTAWCIATLSVRVQVATGTMRSAEWTIQVKTVEGGPLHISEPVTCGRAKADTLSLVGMERIVIGAEAVRRIVLRLRKDGECDLILTLPDQEHSSARTALQLLQLLPEDGLPARDVYFDSEIDKVWSQIDWPK